MHERPRLSLAGEATHMPAPPTDERGDVRVGSYVELSPWETEPTLGRAPRRLAPVPKRFRSRASNPRPATADPATSGTMRDLAEPSDGLEPSTPSLPWRCSTN